jgi:hypothetical protein
MNRNLEEGTEKSDSDPALIEESRHVAIGSQADESQFGGRYGKF